MLAAGFSWCLGVRIGDADWDGVDGVDAATMMVSGDEARP